jgi:hypothetical protein
MAGLAERAGVALNTVKAAEAGADSRRSTIEELEATFKDHDILFAPGAIGVKMVWAEGLRPESAEVREAVLFALNAQRKSRGQAPFIDLGDEP